jgi:hypothetical protein
MNTKIIMTISSIILGFSGIILIFVPDVVIGHLNLESNRISILLGQIIGGLYIAFSMLNWMIKGSLIGGIYNRPIAVANFAHFLIVGLSITKLLISNPDLPYMLWGASFIYILFGLLFGIMLFRHPIVDK